MDLLQIAEYTVRLQHRHEDGSLGTFEAVERSHHSPSDHDPERDWGNGTIYRCGTCDEEIVVTPVDPPGRPVV